MLNMDRVSIRMAAIALAAMLGTAPASAQEGMAPLLMPDIPPPPAAGAEPDDPGETRETREARIDRLYAELADADAAPEGERIAEELRLLWARSGSDSMDLLLRRGRDALRAQDLTRARAHLSALTRLAPDFAEGWNAAATLAYMEEDFGRSIYEIGRAIALDPRNFSALAGLAINMERIERPKDALRTWREIQRLYPTLDKAQEAIDRLSPEVDGRTL